jgi:hypothetical protein
MAYIAFAKNNPVVEGAVFTSSSAGATPEPRKHFSTSASGKRTAVKRETDFMYDEELYRTRSPRPSNITTSRKGKERAVSREISPSSVEGFVSLPPVAPKRKKKRSSHMS